MSIGEDMMEDAIAPEPSSGVVSFTLRKETQLCRTTLSKTAPEVLRDGANRRDWRGGRLAAGAERSLDVAAR
ncbi:MAG TPA: hypothetical protein VGP64_14815, partial [Polyangia bacterium]